VIELLNAYRILNLNAVESIIKWKEQLVYALILNKNGIIGKHKTLVFEWAGENYIHKMRTDLNFYFLLTFERFLLMKTKKTLCLFFLRNFLKKGSKPNENTKILKIPAILQKLVKLAHNYIMDEDVEEQLKTVQVDHKINKKPAKKITEELVDSYA
jgi:hypothetical protein